MAIDLTFRYKRYHELYFDRLSASQAGGGMAINELSGMGIVPACTAWLGLVIKSVHVKSFSYSAVVELLSVEVLMTCIEKGRV